MPISKLLFVILYLSIVSFSCTHKKIDIPTDITPEIQPLKDINPKVAIGSVIEPDVSDKAYLDLIKSELNTGQALWYARWGGWSAPQSFDFEALNRVINWMGSNDIKPMVHMLLGPDNYMPDWLIDSTWQEQALDSLMQSLITNVMEANDNKNKVAVWNVINELFDDDGTYRTNMLWNKMGWESDSSRLIGEDKINDKHPVFIRKAFTYCRSLTQQKLELRDFNIESGINKYDNYNYKKNLAIYQLLTHMLNTGVPVDAVGIQGHISVGNNGWRLNDEILMQTVRKFKNLGIEVYITELDARIEDRIWSSVLAEMQKEDYYNYTKQAIIGGATQIHFWGVQDGLDKSWITNEHPLPWDENLQRKPAYYGVQKALMETKDK